MRNFTGPVEICGARLAHELLDTTLPPDIPAEIEATYRAHAYPPRKDDATTACRATTRTTR